jgi:hypothetical protein
MKTLGDRNYAVKSQSGNGSCYVQIANSGFVCSCSDDIYRGVRGKHIHAVNLSRTYQKVKREDKLHSTKTTTDDSSTSKTSSRTKLIRSGSNNSKDNSKSNTKLSHIKKIISTDSGSSLKKKTTKSDDHGNSKHSDDSTDATPSPH